LLTIELLLYASKNPSCYRSRALPETCLVSSKSWKCSFAPCSPQHSNLVAPSKNNYYSYPNVHSYTLIYHIICWWDFSQGMQVLIYSIQTLLLHQNSFGLQYITKRMAQSQYQPTHGSAYQCGNACIYIYNRMLIPS